MNCTHTAICDVAAGGRSNIGTKLRGLGINGILACAELDGNYQEIFVSISRLFSELIEKDGHNHLELSFH